MEAHRSGETAATKKPSLEDEEAELLIVLQKFRKNWMEMNSEFFGPFEATTGTDSGPPSGGMHYDALEIFSLKVDEIKEGLEWPLRVFGLVAVRDSMDYKRNILFHRSKENCQILTEEDHYLELTGPSRAIALIDNPEYEVELSVVGNNPSEGKILSAAVFGYNNNSYGESLAGLVRTRIVSAKRSTIELKYSHLKLPLEATIEIHHLEGSCDFHGLFFAHVEYMGEEKIVLLHSRDSNLTVEPDGSIPLSRCVVLVEDNGKLMLGVKAWQGENGQDTVVQHAVIPAKFHSKSNGELDVGFCKMAFSVYWSVLC
ncbi:unnamed protein product [Urochloa decumbens]|uniref:DUF6598 domain-containing protein n=1 Tax=Urochloa decumbens TaxID=240449 RepID=A0ABC8Z8H8_9POAL